MLREELRIHQARMAQLTPHRRPYYPPAERMAILQLRAARNWSLEQTAKAFLVTVVHAAIPSRILTSSSSMVPLPLSRGFGGLRRAP